VAPAPGMTKPQPLSPFQPGALAGSGELKPESVLRTREPGSA
jgi:hypothetical protein